MFSAHQENRNGMFAVDLIAQGLLPSIVMMVCRRIFSSQTFRQGVGKIASSDFVVLNSLLWLV